jgi:hypothetical protein
VLLYFTLKSQWRYSLWTDKLAAAMQIAKRVRSLAQEQDDSALMIGACRALAVPLYFLGDFKSSRKYAMRGVQIWRSGGVQSHVEDINAPVVICLYFRSLSEWQFGQIAPCRVTMTEAISLHAEMERLASDLIELSTRQTFATFLPLGAILRGWARGASGDTTEGISWIEDGIGDYRVTGSILTMPYLLALKAEVLHLANRTSEALDAIKEAEVQVERSEERWWCAELHRLRGVFLTAIGAEEAEIEASFCAAISTAKQQKSISLEKRAEATYAEHRRLRASGTGGR